MHCNAHTLVPPLEAKRIILEVTNCSFVHGRRALFGDIAEHLPGPPLKAALKGDSLELLYTATLKQRPNNHMRFHSNCFFANCDGQWW